MLCPACNNELKTADRLGVEIDYCPQCRGVWLDRGELDKIIERAAAASAHHFHDGDDRPRPYPPGNRGKNFPGDLFDFD